MGTHLQSLKSKLQKFHRKTMIFSLYIFNRQGFCIHYQAFQRNRRTKTKEGQKVKDLSYSEEFKLVFGLIFSIRGISQKLGPSFSARENFNSYQTNTYKLTLLTIPTGLKFILLTDPMRSTENVKQALQELYSRTFYNYVIRHKKWLEITKFTEEENGEKIEEGEENDGIVKISSFLNRKFGEETGKYMESLPFYN